MAKAPANKASAQQDGTAARTADGRNLWFDICTRIFKSWRRAVINVLINMLSKPLTRTSR